MTPTELLDALWRDYVATTPQADRIHALLAARGELIRNDHVALRTYGAPGIGIEALAQPFEDLGWRAQDRYRFEDKHLRARYWQHADIELPKVYISELVLSELSPSAQAVIGRLVAQLPADVAARADRRVELLQGGRPWRPTSDDYQTLLAESEHAAWVAAFGFRVHHFTIDVNELSTFPDLIALDAFLIEHGFVLNDRGGTIKGSRDERLERSSTRAEEIEIELADRAMRIHSGCYEFARRYPLPSGELFQGFIPPSPEPFESAELGAVTGR